ncbi:MAG: 2-succinyl-5-enolpyruvyl-6-hydroxy-3-cyclohexene-1-carboxylic-acid synthase [Acidimicrobiales bacterium]
MSRSVPSASEAQATFSATLFDQWAQLGLRDVVISPGSRSTPLVLAAAATEGLTLHVRLDERSAGFFALGRALATRRPVAVVVTSGTAATELHACVAEADLAFVPLIVVTADRPPNLHGVGAPQTIEQAHLYGDMVRRSTDTFVVNFEDSPRWRDVADDLWYSATGMRPGPVQLNAAFLEPLVADSLELPGRSGRYVARVEHEVPSVDVRGLAVLCVVGRGVSRETIEVCRQLNWVVLGDATANGTLAYFDALLRSSDFVERVRPDIVVRLGGLPASKVLAEQLRAWSARTIALDGAGFVADPDRLVGETYAGLPVEGVTALVGDEAYATTWANASREVGRWLEKQDHESELVEPALARAVVAASNESGAALAVGSSMPVRDVEWWAPARTSATYANRGVNGIDGVVSTILGVAAGSRAIGYVGDLTMLHDVSSLVDGLGTAGGTCVLVVADNRGGGIFSFLTQASRVSAERFEQLFGTPRPLDLEAVARAFGHHATTVTTLDELRGALDKGLGTEGLSVVVARVPSREDNVAIHDSWNESVAALVARR